MLMVALVCIMLLLTLLDAVTRNARLRAFERLHGDKQLSKKRRGEAGLTAVLFASRRARESAAVGALHTRSMCVLLADCC
jgi:hypothetical protein